MYITVWQWADADRQRQLTVLSSDHSCYYVSASADTSVSSINQYYWSLISTSVVHNCKSTECKKVHVHTHTRALVHMLTHTDRHTGWQTAACVCSNWTNADKKSVCKFSDTAPTAPSCAASDVRDVSISLAACEGLLSFTVDNNEDGGVTEADCGTGTGAGAGTVATGDSKNNHQFMTTVVSNATIM